jgi:hypothetical protein
MAKVGCPDFSTFGARRQTQPRPATRRAPVPAVLLLRGPFLSTAGSKLTYPFQGASDCQPCADVPRQGQRPLPGCGPVVCARVTSDRRSFPQKLWPRFFDADSRSYSLPGAILAPIMSSRLGDNSSATGRYLGDESGARLGSNEDAPQHAASHHASCAGKYSAMSSS